MVVRCKAARDTEAWYNANKDQIFASFGTLYSAQMSVDGIDPRVGEAYPDMCLVSNGASYTQTGEYVISFVYETLTSVWTKEQDDEVTSTDNGLRVLERSEVAKVDGFPIVQLKGTLVPFDTSKVVLGGMGNASNYFVLLVKADSANTIYWRATNEALDTQTGSFTTANTDQWEYKVIYTPISIDQLEIGYDGTNYSTFDLSEFYLVSQSSDWQNNIVESFIEFEVTVDNLSPFNDTVVFTGSNGNTATGTNVQGGGTGSISSPYDEDDVGVATITDGGKTLYLASFQDQTGAESNAQVGRVVTRWAEAGILSRTEDFVGSQDSLVIEAIGPDPSTPLGFSLASKQESNYEGFQTNRFTFLKDNVVLSVSEDKVGSQKAVVNEVFNPDSEAITGIDTSGTALTGYSEANRTESDYEGIKTIRVQFLKPSILSLQQDFNNGLKRVSVQAFNLDSAAVSAALSEVTVDHKLIATNESDYEGIKTTTFQYQIDESFTEDYELNGLKRISLIELSATNFTAQDVGSVSTTAPTTDLYLGTQSIDNGGVIKVRESTWIETGTLNVQRRSESEGVYRVTTTFLGAQGTVVGPIVAKSEDDYDGLKTITVVHMQKADETSLIDDEAAIVTHNSLSEFSYPGVVTISNELLSASGNTYQFQAKDFKLEPPSVALIPSTTKVFFKTTNSITYSANHSLWSPRTWAQGESRGIAWNYLPFSNTQAFRGYRIDTSEGNINSYSAFGTLGGGVTSWDMISGRRIYAGTKYRIEVSGGPPDPVGNDYTLSYDIAHAFSDIDGTPYYKHTEVIATIPAKT